MDGVVRKVINSWTKGDGREQPKKGGRDKRKEGVEEESNDREMGRGRTRERR